MFKTIALGLIRFYQGAISPWLGSRCRFDPSCSRFAARAFEIHSPARATLLTVKRLSRCHPLGSYGLDPVPERNLN